MCDDARWQEEGEGLLLNAHVTLKNLCKRINTINNCKQLHPWHQYRIYNIQCILIKRNSTLHSNTQNCLHDLHYIQYTFTSIYNERCGYHFLYPMKNRYNWLKLHSTCKYFLSTHDRYENTIVLHKPEIQVHSFITIAYIHKHLMLP